MGFDAEGVIGENEAKGITDLGNGCVSLPESMILETNSSFGSSSSSTSSANVSPPIKLQSEDFGLSLPDNAAKQHTTSDSAATLVRYLLKTFVLACFNFHCSLKMGKKERKDMFSSSNFSVLGSLFIPLPLSLCFLSSDTSVF